MPHRIICAHCGRDTQLWREGRYCRSACRSAAHRARVQAAKDADAPPSLVDEVAALESALHRLATRISSTAAA